MARENLSLSFLCFLLFMAVCNSSRDSTIWGGQKRGIVTRTWCVANPFLGDDELQKAIDYYCNGQGVVDCRVIRPGGPCFLPNTVQEHASVVFDYYYKAHNGQSSFCPNHVAGLTIDNPSHGSCIYP
ncbi:PLASMODESMATA CALLOSE-BINDING PROTEIN 5-like [Actinidia eriantha]|uniref:PLASMODESMATA CALLOSE-BINDING PROTEIN 5-like n=1 Tax=Actinidia eriantha TaxID=165200 RepID=UPI00258B30DB|nr:PLASMODESMATA CALLOSE-BINDING PROTEIN 5-like [Actinidia eriantha]